jgi:hypothetical protein
MKEIPLTQGKVALVDDDKYDELMQYKWYVMFEKKSGNWYAARKITLPNGRRRHLYMHTAIVNPSPGYMIDHIISGDTLNNQDNNLRSCTCSQNQANRGKTIKNTSGAKGVTFSKKIGKYKAAIGFNGRLIHLGYYVNLSDAAKAYDEAAVKYYGEFAYTNKQLNVDFPSS